MFYAAQHAIGKYPKNPLTGVTWDGISYSISYNKRGNSYTIRRNE
jgi:hypothetical protein